MAIMACRRQIVTTDTLLTPEYFQRVRCAISAGMLRLTFLIEAGLLAASVAAIAEQRMISIGDRRLSVYCDGTAGLSATVVLIPAGGRTAKDWETIQPAISSFTRVCSY